MLSSSSNVYLTLPVAIYWGIARKIVHYTAYYDKADPPRNYFRLLLFQSSSNSSSTTSVMDVEPSAA
ncbi:hypothetical protein CC77DRAFT_634037 [Alternaria alternata]|uniref:Uncharacterized protein n=1 Tax=Alternaria alternata TaxID=5599 RepID=A0A177DW01_ALTAL|nr:hypothetical protein CC77DRAFT_634037 [Alternaria alternata]OAG23874.1 hypothetical protein CC77DRAFT_634037 [Alternaria alternata]